MNKKQITLQNQKLIIALAAALSAAPAFATEVAWSGDIVIRPFHRENAADFNSQTADTKNFTTERARLKAEVKLDDEISGTMELMNLKMWGTPDPNRVMGGANSMGACSTGAAVTASGGAGSNCADMSWFGLNQAYITVKNVFGSGWYLKAGSQEMAYGDQRLIGNTNFWSTFPFPRAYDAIKVGASYDTFDVDAFMAKVTERQLGTLMGGTTSAAGQEPGDRDLRGIWATLKNIPNNTLDLYVLNMSDTGVSGGGTLDTVNGTVIAPNFGWFPYAYTGSISKGTNVYNWGARIKGGYNNVFGGNGNVDYTLELNDQTGTAADGNSISASAAALRAGYTIPEAMGLRIGGEYVYASGDDDPTSGEHKTFYQFTPSPHGMLGAQDFIAFQNIKAFKLGASFNPKANLKLSADFWDFKLAQANDYWYGSNGISTRSFVIPTVVNPPVGVLNTLNTKQTGAEGILNGNKVGTEVDLVANYVYSKPLTFEAGYSVFNPGSGIKNTTAANLPGITTGSASDSAKFAWCMLTLKF